MAETKEKEIRPGKIYVQMTKILKDTSAVAKERQAGGGLPYAFRGIDDVYNAIHDTLAKHAVFTVPTVLEERSEERKSKEGKTLIYRILRIAYRFFADDGSFVSSIVIGEGMDTGDKAANKAMAVAHKYALLQAFCIPTEDSKDVEEDHHEVTEKKKTTTAKEKEEEKSTNGKEKSAVAPKASTEEEYMGGAKPPSRFDTAVHMTVKGERTKVSYKEALEHFANAKKFLGNQDYYAVLGDKGFEKSDEIPFNKLDEIYKLMLKRYNDKRADFS